VIVYGLASLERRRAPAAGALFARYASSPEAEVRLFAVRGLKALASSDRPVEALKRALEVADWRVQVEACLGLGLCDDSAADAALGAATRALSPHVRRTAWEALGGRVDRLQTQTEARALQRLLEPYWLSATQFDNEPSESVQAAFLELELPLLARIRSLGGGWTRRQNSEMAIQIDEVARRQPPVVLAGLARALARIPEDFAREGLGSLAAHSDPFVATAAIEALARHPGEWTHGLLLGLLEHQDPGRRLAAVTALEGMVDEVDMPALVDLYATTRGEIGPEVRFLAVRAAQKASPRMPSPVAELALSDPDPYVRRLAREVYATLTVLPPRTPPPAPVEEAALPVPGDGLPDWTRNPQVELRTARGTLVLELFPAEAPVHVFNFLELARRGVYDGLDVHRVVPDFVVQGGDPRGDGNGGTSWRGGSLREEIGPRKYTRGSLGMPRNENPDSGGGQIFLTHRRTPHLDGRYTIFGQVVAGMRVLDELEVGDAILTVREL
jgi:cyclophilin family peptidyl-prolyl cis-trans isomerase/HEAT repeat protein